MVQARDFTHDPGAGADMHRVVASLLASRDPRLKYVIFSGKMASSYATSSRRAWVFGPYGGSNPHHLHLHVSVADSPATYDNPGPWAIGAGSFKLGDRVLRQGMAGPDVAEWQTFLSVWIATDVKVDGNFGPRTDVVTRQFQTDMKIGVDGTVGPASLTARDRFFVELRECAKRKEHPLGMLTDDQQREIYELIKYHLSPREGVPPHRLWDLSEWTLGEIDRRVPRQGVLTGMAQELSLVAQRLQDDQLIDLARRVRDVLADEAGGGLQAAP